MFTEIIVWLDLRSRDVVKESPIVDVVVLQKLQVHELVNDVFSNLRAAAEANTLLDNNYTIDVNSVTLGDRKYFDLKLCCFFLIISGAFIFTSGHTKVTFGTINIVFC